jgi:hypothetical protein
MDVFVNGKWNDVIAILSLKKGFQAFVGKFRNIGIDVARSYFSTNQNKGILCSAAGTYSRNGKINPGLPAIGIELLEFFELAVDFFFFFLDQKCIGANGLPEFGIVVDGRYQSFRIKIPQFHKGF